MKANKKRDKEVRLNYIYMPRQEDSGLQRSRHSLIHLLYFMQKERFHVFNKSIIIIVMQ